MRWIHQLIQAKIANITKALALWIGRNSRPISIVEDEGLENLIRVFTENSSFSLPSRSTIKSRVDSFFVDLKEDIQQDLCHADYTALTCDYWSSLSNENYLGMTAHYIDAAFKLQSYALGVSYSEERHISENVAKHIKQVTNHWNITNKVVAIVTDNAKNMVNAVDELPYMHIGCGAHTMKLTMNKALKQRNIDHTLSKARKIVGHVKHSPANYAELKTIQEKRGEAQEALVS